MIDTDVATCKYVDEFWVFVVLSKFQVCVFCFFKHSTQPHNLSALAGDCSFPSGWNTNYQSAAATAASDKSLSDSLMPPNCLETLPVCCLSRPPWSHSASYCCSMWRFLFHLFCFVFISDVLSAPAPSRGLLTFRMSRLRCATGVHSFSKMCFSNRLCSKYVIFVSILSVF